MTRYPAWAAEDDKKLLEMRKECVPLKERAARLGKTVRAVQARQTRLLRPKATIEPEVIAEMKAQQTRLLYLGKTAEAAEVASDLKRLRTLARKYSAQPAAST